MSKKAILSLLLALAIIVSAVIYFVPHSKEPPVISYSTEDVRKEYGDSVAALTEYADYGFKNVQEAPLADVSFDDIESLDELAGHTAALSNLSGAKLIKGRYHLRNALELTSPETYLSLPDMGEQEALTISMWVNVRDLQTRANTDEPRVSTLLDTKTGAGRVALKFVHTGTPSYEDKTTGEAVMGTNSTKLVFSVQGNSGGEYEDNSVCANNTQFCNFEYNLSEDFVGYKDDWVVHPEGHCWFHIGVVYEPEKGDVTFYHCGKFDSTKHFETAVKPVLNGVRIGAGYAENEYFDGRIDDIRLYGTALGQADMDILADYEQDMWANRTASDWEESQTVLYVNGETGDDANPGTKEAPFATVKKGVEAITAPGTRLVIAPGVYNENSINLNTSGTERQPVIIEAEQPGETMITATVPFDGWKKAGANLYENEWNYDYPIQEGTPGNEIIGRSDLILLDGVPIAPVLEKKELKNDTYFIDKDAGRIYLKTKKKAGEFKAERALEGENGSGAYILETNSNEYIVLRGLTFTGCATRIWDKSMVNMGKPQHVLVEDCTFNNAGTAGLGFDHGSNDRTVEDVLIRRCTFDHNGTGGIGAGFRSMNFVVEDCEFANIGSKIDWGKYDAADPATTKMMVSKNITWRGCYFAHNISNDLWFDNFNWNVDVENCAFYDNHSGIAVHIEIDVPGVRVRNSVLDGGVRFASAEGAILDSNIIFAKDNPLIDNWGDKYRFASLGPVYSWKNTVMTNNTFYCENKHKPEFIFDLPPHEEFYAMYANGNRFYIKNGRQSEKTYRAMDEKISYKKLISMLGDENADYLSKDPFDNNETVTVGFADSASHSKKNGDGSRIPVMLSQPMNEQCTVYYTVWDYDAGMVLRKGELHFDRFETAKTICIGENEHNVLIEISGVKNITRGEKAFHFIAKETN